MIEWISIEDRLPVEKQRVLIYTTDNHIFDYSLKKIKVRTATFLKGRIRNSNQSWCWPDYHPNLAPNNLSAYGWEDGALQWDFNEVTHWAEINEPENKK